MLPHLPGQMCEDLVTVGYSYLERRVAHAFCDGSVNGDHVFSRNGDTSFSIFTLSESTHAPERSGLNFLVDRAFSSGFHHIRRARPGRRCFGRHCYARRLNVPRGVALH